MTTIRPAVEDDALTVRRILDAAMLEFGDIEGAIEREGVLVAVEGENEGATADDEIDERILGALVLESSTGTDGSADADESTEDDGSADSDESTRDDESADSDESTAGATITAVAVRRRRRHRGVGTALVEAALEREGRVTARFDESVRAFYESLDFEIGRVEEGRFEGRRSR